MRRTATAGLALTCAITILPGTAPASASTPAAVANPAAAAPQTEDATLSGGTTPTSAVSAVAANARMSEVLRTRTRSKILGKNFTMTVWDTASSSYVYRRRGNKSLRGASTTKILTSVGALASLGPDHRFATTVRAGSTPDEVVLVAGGDPLLTSADLRKLAKRTAKALAAQTIEPDPTPSDPATADPADPAPSDPATADPASSSTARRKITVRADDSLFSGGGISRGWSASWVPSEVRRVGAFARDDNKATDSTADAGAFFAAALRALDVRATYAGEAKAAPGADILATFAGHSVAQAVSRALLISDNDTAEMLFRQVAVARGIKASWPGARRAMRETLTELAVPLQGVRIVDGSGLSLAGRLSAPALTSALNRALSPENPRLAGLRGWLPIAGQTGSLQAAYLRFTSAPARCAAGLIQAKTGTLADAISLAGYATGADGNTKIFVSIVNSRPTRYTRLTTRKAVDRAASSITGCW